MSLQAELARHLREERHHTRAETIYWCEQYRRLAVVAVAANTELQKKLKEAEEALKGDGHESL